MSRKTLGDRAVGLWHNYIATTKKDIGKKETKLTAAEAYDPLLQKQGYVKLTPIKRRELANQSPIFMKGVRKKNLDTFRAWFQLKTTEDRGKPIAVDEQIFQNFEKRTHYKKKMEKASECAYIYGDGFLLITFTNDEEVPLSQPPKEGAEPYSVKVLNPEFITEVDYLNETYQKKDIKHFVYVKDGVDRILIHPDRIQHIKIDCLPFSELGISKIDILRWTIESKKNVDIATGRILSWFSHGILDLQWEGMEDEERKEMLKVAAEHPGAWVHNEDVEIKIHNPTAINPKPFYDFILLNISAVLNMPTHILTGIQTGRVTGSEIGFGDYYRDIHDLQELVFTPLIEDLYRRILKARGRTFKYFLAWNAIYVDEMTEAKLLFERSKSIAILLDKGVIDQEESRKMLNDGLIEVDTQKKVEMKPLPKPSQPNPDDRRPRPARPPAPKGKPKNNAEVRGGLSDEERAMIERCRLAKELTEQDRVKKEKKLGKDVLEEQDEE